MAGLISHGRQACVLPLGDHYSALWEAGALPVVDYSAFFADVKHSD